MDEIKAIAFDLGGVLMSESSHEFTPEEEILESQFGNINDDKEFFDWAKSKLDMSFDEIKSTTKNLIINLYDLRYPEIFKKYSKYKLAIATNHLSFISEWIKRSGIKKYLDAVVISSKVGSYKPERKFYDVLARKLKEDPKNILFVDDDFENVQGALDFGMQGIVHSSERDLVQEIDNYLILNNYKN